MRQSRRCSLALVLLLAAPGFATDDPILSHLEWRSIGPVNMSGRVADVEGVPGDPRVLWVGAASGGVWKTVDGGLTFRPLFDEQPVASIGDLGLAPSNPDVVYVGTGESNARNSVSIGNGVYKTTDGGASWTHLGLEETRQISRVLVHPSDPDTVWVGALGHLFGPNEERGVYRSTDGGASWQKVLYVDDSHGVSDLALDPTNPNILYAAFWHFDRKPWTHTTGSEEGGVWRSVDGGTSWQKLEEGLPKLMGRIAVKVAPSDPQVVYVMAETHEGTLFRSDDRGKSFEKVSEDVQIVSRGLYYTDLRVDPSDANRVYAVSSRLFLSIDGGRSFERISRRTHVDFHSLWIDPEDPRRIWQGQDGGVAVSYDRGRSWEPVRNLPIGQFYQVFHDDREPFYAVGGGMQDNGTWIGPSRTREPDGILPDDWRMMSFGDAYFVVPHPEVDDLFLSESQGGGILRTDMRTRQQMDVSPQPRRNDGGPVGILPYRFNWNAPIVASPHDPGTVYFAGNVVFETTDFGDSWRVISPDLTTDDPAKQGEAGGPAWTENTTAEYHCTLISFAESPAQAGVLWAGSDDGLVHVSRDGGEGWTRVDGALPGLPEFSPVSHLEPSRSGAGVAYAAFDRHMFDDYRPHLFRTEDFGASWRRLSTRGIPETAWIWVVREDPQNPELLWAGTELGLYASHDRGGQWMRLHLANLPTVAVHDVLVHPRENDLILGTHGRAIWIFDDATPLQQLKAIRGASAHLFPLRPALRFPTRFTRYGLGDKQHTADNPPAGALISYYLKEGLDGEPGEKEAEPTTLSLEILDGNARLVRTLDPEKLERSAGIHRTAWDLAEDAHRERRDEAPEPSEFRPGPRGPRVLPGTYTVRLTVGESRYERTVEVKVDPLIEVEADGLRAQYEMARQLKTMHSTVNDGLRALDSIASQLEARTEALGLLDRELPEALEGDVAAWKEAADELSSRLAGDEDKPRWAQGPRLVERIGDLFRNVDSQFAAPTQAQQIYFRELETELGEAEAALETLLSDRLPALNEALESHGVPPVAPPDPGARSRMGP